jgi:predicted transcriptional regulator
MQLQLQILALRNFRLTIPEIAKELNIGTDRVSQFLQSELAQGLLEEMREASAERAVDLRAEMDTILKEEIELPRQMIKGRVRQTVTRRVKEGDKEVEVEEEVMVTVDPVDRMKAYVEVSKIAGYGVAKITVDNRSVNIDRLQIIRQRAQDEGLLAPSELEVEDA